MAASRVEKNKTAERDIQGGGERERRGAGMNMEVLFLLIIFQKK